MIAKMYYVEKGKSKMFQRNDVKIIMWCDDEGNVHRVDDE